MLQGLELVAQRGFPLTLNLKLRTLRNVEVGVISKNAHS